MSPSRNPPPPADPRADGLSSPAVRAELEKRLAEARKRETSGDAAGALALLSADPGELARFGMYHYAVGALRARLGDSDAAIASLERAVALEPDIPEFRGNLGAALLHDAYSRDREGLPRVRDAGRLARALEVLERAVRDRPRLADPYSNYGLALLLDGRPAESLRALERALAVDPEHLPSLYNKAIALHAGGDDAACRECLERCLRLDPSFEPARTSLGQLP